VHSFVNKSAVSSVSGDFKCSKHMGRLSVSVCLSVCMTAVTDRQTDRHATASVHQTTTSSTANGAESQDIQMLHCVSARRSLLSQCHLTAVHRNMQPSLCSFSRNSQCPNLLYQFSRTPTINMATITFIPYGDFHETHSDSIICGYPVYRILWKSENVANTGRILFAPFSTTV